MMNFHMYWCVQLSSCGHEYRSSSPVFKGGVSAFPIITIKVYALHSAFSSTSDFKTASRFCWLSFKFGVRYDQENPAQPINLYSGRNPPPRECSLNREISKKGLNSESELTDFKLYSNLRIKTCGL